MNDATLAALTSARGGGAGEGGRSGRRISDLCAYKAPADVPHARDLAVQACRTTKRHGVYLLHGRSGHLLRPVHKDLVLCKAA